MLYQYDFLVQIDEDKYWDDEKRNPDWREGKQDHGQRARGVKVQVRGGGVVVDDHNAGNFHAKHMKKQGEAPPDQPSSLPILQPLHITEARQHPENSKVCPNKEDHNNLLKTEGHRTDKYANKCTAENNQLLWEIFSFS